MSEMIKKLENSMESEKGKVVVSEWVQKYANDIDHKNRWIEKFKNRCEGDLNGTMKKLLDKYHSDEYVKRWYKRSCEPEEALLWLAFEYARKYCKEYNGKKHINSFTAVAYHFGTKYVIQLMIGQGSAVVVDKK